MELNPELAPFIAAWQRIGLTEERIAKRIERHLRLAKAEAGEEDGDTCLLNEDLDRLPEDESGADDDQDPQPAAATQEPAASPEVAAAKANGMQVMADPGNEPKQTREPPNLVRPRAGRPPIDINSPDAERMLQRFRLMSPQEIAEQKPPQWLVARYIPEDSLIELFGDYGSCKTFLSLAWALHIATGKPWLRRKVQPGHVVYVYAEGTRGLKKRMLAWCKENGLAGLDDLHGRFHAIPCAVNVRDPTMLDFLALSIKLTLKGEKPKLIVIDTFNRCSPGCDENSTKDVSDFFGGCDVLREEFGGASVLIVHHSGKDRAKGGRGASALGGAMDVIFELVKESRDKPLATLLNNTATTKPQKDSAPLPDLALEFVEVEIDGLALSEDDPHATTSLVARLANASAIAEAAADKKTGRRSKVEQTFEALQSFPDGAKFAEWQDKVAGVSETAFRRHIKHLTADGRVERVERPGASDLYRIVDKPNEPQNLDDDELMDEDLSEL